jgi:histidyl-tRNA synthetase
MNNKKLLQGFLESCNISKVAETIAVIDKKDKVKTIVPMLEELELSSEQIEKILEYIKIAEEKNSSEILEIFANNQNELLQEGLAELSYVFQNLVKLGVSEDSLKINPAISRGLNYYTGTVFETFIAGAESMGSISSGGRYENLCGNFTKNPYPGVGGSIGLSRLIAVLQQLENDAIQPKAKTTSEILVLNMDEELLADCLEIVKTLRNAGVPTEIYLDSSAKMKKQMKYADNKNIKKVLIFGGNEKENGTVMLKNLDGGAQKEISLEKLVSEINL